MTTSALWDVVLVSAQSPGCDNEIPDGAGFQNVSEGKEFSLCCSLKVCVRALIDIDIIYCELFLSSNKFLLEKHWKSSLLALVILDLIAELFSHVCFCSSHWNGADFWFCCRVLSHQCLCSGSSTLCVPQITAEQIMFLACVCTCCP